MKTGTLLRVLALCLATASTAFAGRLAPPLQQQAQVEIRSETGAEILQSRQRTTVQSDLHWQSVEYVSIRINDLDAARDYGRISIGFNHYYSDLELAFANVLTPGGELKSVKADALQERVGGSQDFYEDRTELVFSLPDIAPGSVIEFQIERRSKKVIMPGLFDDTLNPYWYQPKVGGDGGRLDPVRFSRQQLDYPADITLHRVSVGTEAPAYTSRQREGRKVASWEWRDLPAVPVEATMEPIDNLLSRVRVSTLTDWSRVSQWSWELARDKWTSGEAVAEVARSFDLEGAGREAKLKAVYAFLQQNIRYVFAHLGRGGYEPHSAAEVLQQGYGDCKDQTVLAIALLRELGVSAYPALVSTRRNGQPDTRVVSQIFDHMIVHVPAWDGETVQWMDTTGDRALYPGVSNYLINQDVLVADGESGELITLNEQLPPNRVVLNMDYHVDEDDHLAVDVRFDLTGVYEQNIRNWWIHSANRATDLDQLVGALFPDAKGDTRIDARLLHADDLWQPVAIAAQFDFGALDISENPLTYGVGVSQIYRLFGGFNALQVPRERQSRWVHEFREEMRIEAVFRGWQSLQVPQVVATGVDIDNAFFRIHQSGEQRDDGSYRVDIAFEQAPLDLSREAYARYYQALKRLSDAGHWLVRFVEDDVETARRQVAGAGGALDELLDKVRFHLDNGEFEQALAPARAAVETDAGSGEAWYLLGLAQGYNAQLEASRQSFARATDLGYTP